MPKPFPEEFRRDVIAVTRKGDDTIEQVAKDFGVSASTLHRWLKAADAQDSPQPGASGSGESESMKELRKRNRLLEQENEILRKAAAYLAQGVLPK
ncbi:hypothetical protein GCM10027456_07350 [Kineosporia babensis]